MSTVFEISALAEPCSVNAATSVVVCRCLNVTEAEIQNAISVYDACTVREIGRCTGAGKGCMSCHGRLKALIAQK